MTFRSFLHLQAGRKAKQPNPARSGPIADVSGQSEPKSAPQLSPIKRPRAGPDVLPLIIGPIIMMAVGLGALVLAALLVLA